MLGPLVVDHYHPSGVSRHCRCQSFVGMGVVQEYREGIVNIAMCLQTPQVDLAILDYVTMVVPLYNITGFLDEFVVAFFGFGWCP